MYVTMWCFTWCKYPYPAILIKKHQDVNVSFVFNSGQMLSILNNDNKEH